MSMKTTWRLAIVAFCAFLFVASPCRAAEEPENLARRASVSASDEYSGHFAARFAVDGVIPFPLGSSC